MHIDARCAQLEATLTPVSVCGGGGALQVGDDRRVKLCDFGNARHVPSADAVLKDGIGKGSTPYCAPEIFSRTGPVFAR